MIPLFFTFCWLLPGIIHGIFVSGGPLLIGYLTRKVRDKVSFRATISTIWIFLNSLILFDDIRAGLWDLHLVSIQLLSVPFMLCRHVYRGKAVCDHESETVYGDYLHSPADFRCILVDEMTNGEKAKDAKRNRVISKISSRPLYGRAYRIKLNNYYFQEGFTL